MKILAISPVCYETEIMINSFIRRMKKVKEALNANGLTIQPYFLSDASLVLKEKALEIPTLVTHHEPEPRGLASTLITGYEKALAWMQPDDWLVRLDTNEHDPSKIVEMAEIFSHTKAQFILAPVWYWVQGTARPKEYQIYRELAAFALNILKPWNKEAIKAAYNQRFPMGYQAFSFELLQKVLPLLKEGIRIFQAQYGVSATWGLDLLSLLAAVALEPKSFDIIFGGYAEPWQENRPAEKITEQRGRAEKMLEVAAKLLEGI